MNYNWNKWTGLYVVRLQAFTFKDEQKPIKVAGT